MRARIGTVLAGFLILAAAAARAETITVVGDPWCPYNCEPGAERPGFGIEIAREALAGAGVEVRYQTLPWDEAIAKTRAGDYSAVIGASKEDAPDFVFPASPIGTSNNLVIVRAGDPWRYAGPDSLAGRRVGSIKAYSYGEVVDAWFEKHPAAVEVEGDDPKELLMRKLLAKEIDLFIEDKAVMADYVRRRGVLGLVASAGDVDDPTPVYIAFSPAKRGSDALARRLSEGIAALERSGRLKAILAKYGLTP